MIQVPSRRKGGATIAELGLDPSPADATARNDDTATVGLLREAWVVGSFRDIVGTILASTFTFGAEVPAELARDLASSSTRCAR